MTFTFTFIKAIHMLSRGDFGLNNHFKPMLQHCQYCFAKLDFIGKLETLEEDSKYLFHKIGVNASVLKTMNKSKAGSSSKRINDIFGQITKKELDLLYEYYKVDFDAFGYSVQEYYDMVQK